MSKECGAFARWKKLQAGSDDRPEFLDSPGRCFSQECLEFGKELLDWIEVRTVGRKVKEARPARLDCFADPSDFVDAHVVHNDNVATFQATSQYLLNISFEA